MICRKYSISHRGGPVNTDNTRNWRQFLLLGIGMIGYTICRAGFPVGLAAMGKQFQWTAFEVGILSTIFLLGQAIIDIPAGYWADTWDRKRVIFIGLFGLGLFTALVTLAAGFGMRSSSGCFSA